ncbi:hypothetical protein G6F60_003773 [Rhizopus arrhizus]|nr:hypothetical protein G6F60_003773 [Rhizopus arrhizus]
MDINSLENKQIPIKENAIQRHLYFWDKTKKGYITPVDTIKGFITLGYGIIPSLFLGIFVSVFLSLLTQVGWTPDPFCRSLVSNLIEARTLTSYAYDKNGVFIPKNFENLFNKHAKSGEHITIMEFVWMTREQEMLRFNLKAWAISLIELCTLYFFIGHHGYLSKEGVRAAYDGTLFYRLQETNRIQPKSSLITSYPHLTHSSLLPKKHNVWFLKGQLHALLNSTSLKGSYLHDWVNYFQEALTAIKDKTLLSSVTKSRCLPKLDVSCSEKIKMPTKSDDSDEGLCALVADTAYHDLTPVNDNKNALNILLKEPPLFYGLTIKEDITVISKDGIKNVLFLTNSTHDWPQENKDDERSKLHSTDNESRYFVEHESPILSLSDDDSSLMSSTFDDSALFSPPDSSSSPIVFPVADDNSLIALLDADSDSSIGINSLLISSDSSLSIPSSLGIKSLLSLPDSDSSLLNQHHPSSLATPVNIDSSFLSSTKSTSCSLNLAHPSSPLMKPLIDTDPSLTHLSTNDSIPIIFSSNHTLGLEIESVDLIELPENDIISEAKPDDLIAEPMDNIIQNMELTALVSKDEIMMDSESSMATPFNSTSDATSEFTAPIPSPDSGSHTHHEHTAVIPSAENTTLLKKESVSIITSLPEVPVVKNDNPPRTRISTSAKHTPLSNKKSKKNKSKKNKNKKKKKSR